MSFKSYDVSLWAGYGRRVRKPVTDEPREETRQQPRVPSQCPAGFGSRHTVVRGETMFAIARSFSIAVTTLIQANPHIPDPDKLFVGDVLCVPGPGGRVPEECPPGTAQEYTVEEGDTLISVARNFLVSIEQLIAFNPHIENPNEIFPGDVLCIPVSRPLLPCCVRLSQKEFGLLGSALVQEIGRISRFSVGILLEDLPPAQDFGDFTDFIGQVRLPDGETFEARLFKVEEEPTLTAGRVIFALEEGVTLPTETQIWIRPFNPVTDERGDVFLRGFLSQCIDIP